MKKSIGAVFCFVLGVALIGSASGAELVHLWSFDGNLLDSSASENHGEAFGDISFTEGVSGQALFLDELDDLVENDDANNLPTDPEDHFSLNVWYNLESFPSLAYGGGYGGRLSAAPRSFLSFGPGGSGEDNALYFWGANIDVYAGEDYDTDGMWHMYTVTFDGELIRMYEDGELVHDTDIDKQGEFIADEFIGRGEVLPIVSVGGPSLWDQNLLGAVDEFSIWSGALTDEEIAALYSPTGGLVGDFDGDGVLGIGDIDALSTEIQAGTNNSALDLTGDGLVDDKDLVSLVTDGDKLNSWFGDGNLDGEFNSSDFVQVFQAGLFETGNPATWSDGDWNADGVFDSSDFVSAFQDGGFELGPRPAATAVPEPSALVLMLIATGCLLRFRA